MRIYLAQHGMALPKDIDPDRPLSELGDRDVRRIGDFLRDARIHVDEVIHSSKTRAKQTAAILAESLTPGRQVRSEPSLGPNDPVEPFAERLGEFKDEVLIVGHLPFLGRLVSFLLVGAADRVSVAFKPGSVVCLEKNADTSWGLVWMIRPELLNP
jgi:phosphohistidine phosphatase